MKTMPELCHKTKPLAAELGRIMRRERQDKNLTMRELAEKLGVIHSQIAKIECAQRDLSVLELVHICKTMCTDPQFVMTQILRFYELTVND